MIEEDYVMRMIRDMVRVTLRLLGLDTENPYTPQERRLTSVGNNPGLSQRLQELVARGEIGQAEDLLFAELDFSNPEAFRVAADFYESLAALPDARLEACSYSREEVLDGLRDCAARFGIDRSLLDAFHL